MGVEQNSLEPDPAMYENVVFIDEFPELLKRREVRLTLGGLKRIINSEPTIIEFPSRPEPPDIVA